MEKISELFPDISFIDETTVDQVMAQMINDYQEKYKELTGKEAPLAKANPYRLIMYAGAIQIYQGMQYADHAGKMSLLKYSREDYLDNLAPLRGISRMEPTAATTILRFSIAEAVSFAVPIPEGCMVTNGNDIFFATDEYAEIAAGETEVTVPATCIQTGVSGNGFSAGELNVIVNTLPYVVSVENTSATEGGADIEDDESLKNRIFNAPKSYSTAGPSDAYKYHTKMVDATISDVSVKSSTAGIVDIYFITDGGAIPNSAMIQKVEDYFENRSVRPLTDRVMVHAPSPHDYNIELTYYIPSSSKSAVAMIQADVATAVSIYNTWQTEKIGRDINPSYLIQKIMEAGAKRVVVASPTFTVLDDVTIARAGTISVNYGGIEDD